MANDSAFEVHTTCKNLGIDEENFIYIKNAKKQYGNHNYKIINQVLGDINFAYYCEEFRLYEESFFQDVVCADATNLNSIEDESIESLSALCSLEHFGLGRYGDPVDPEACFKAFDSIRRVMCIGGMVYISVPVGKECLEFNAHRQFYASTIKNAFFDFELVEYSTCLENSIEYDVPVDKYDDEYVHGNYRYGLFALRKVT